MELEKINIAIAGFGNIGSYFYKILEKNKKNISIKTGKIPYVKYLSAKSQNKKRLIKISKHKWIKNAMSLTKKNDVDIIVELIGGSEGAAKKLVFSSLKNGLKQCSISLSLRSSFQSPSTIKFEYPLFISFSK